MRGKAPDSHTGSKRTRPLLIAGAVLLALGTALIVGLYSYFAVTNHVNTVAQQKLKQAWNTARINHWQTADLQGGIARISIPNLHLDAIVVELKAMDDVQTLNEGPSHVPATAMPGPKGNVVIFGHRTTYGAPFGNIDQLKDGDQVTLESTTGIYTYAVVGQKVIGEHDMSVLSQDGPPRVSLCACNPPHRRDQRLVVTAVLVHSIPSAGTVAGAPGAGKAAPKR